MKKVYFLLLGFFLFSGVNAQVINFPDANFKSNLLESSLFSNIARDINGNRIKIDANDDGEIQYSEALIVYQLDVSYSTNVITNLVGVEYFTNLTFLNCME